MMAEGIYLETSEPRQSNCKRCDGQGTLGPVHINRGEKPHEWRNEVTCWDCDGTGVWSEKRMEAWQKGRRQRAARIEKGETMIEAASRLGVSVAVLCAIEAGRSG